MKTMEQAREAPLDLIDYVCIGGVFATMSKDNPQPPIGVDGLRRIAAEVRARKQGFPVGAIAGIDASNAADVMTAGVDGVAVISALSMTKDPRAAARDLRALVDDAKARQ
jgi:thiamine-phosphate pyrophosphorylase